LPFLRFGSLCAFSLCVATAITLSGCSLGGGRNSHANQAQSAPAVHAPGASGQDGPTPMDTFRALAPPEGLKFSQLFAEPVSDPNARMQRLEDSLQALRNDFDTVVPSMVRLVSVEKDMKELVRQLQTLTDQQPTSAPFEQTPLAAPQAATPLPPAPTPQTAAPAQPNASGAPVPLVAPPAAQTTNSPAAPGQPIPGGDAARGTETAGTQKAGTTASSSLVTPEAAPKGELPPEGAASPNSAVANNGAGSAPPAAPKSGVYWTAPNSMAATDMRNRGTPPPAPVAKPAMQDNAAPAATAPTGKSSVSAVRVGDHPDKTRVVLDLTARADFNVSLENKNKTLVVEMPGADWSAVKPYDAMSAALVAGWHVEGDKLKLDLLYPSAVKSKSLVPPKGATGYRLVIDLFSKDVHQ
jgi:hypothetical protein